MGFIWFFLICYSMGSASRLLELIENKVLRFVASIGYYLTMACIALLIYKRFGITISD